MSEQPQRSTTDDRDAWSRHIDARLDRQAQLSGKLESVLNELALSLVVGVDVAVLVRARAQPIAESSVIFRGARGRRVRAVTTTTTDGLSGCHLDASFDA